MFIYQIKAAAYLGVSRCYSAVQFIGQIIFELLKFVQAGAIYLGLEMTVNDTKVMSFFFFLVLVKKDRG